MDPVLAIAIPSAACALGLFGFILNKISSRNFDRKYPHLSRSGMRVMATVRQSRPSLDVPLVKRPFSPPGRPQGLFTEGEEIGVEQSLDHLGRNVASDLQRRRSIEQSAA